MRFLEEELAAYLAERGEPGDASDFVAWLDESLRADPVASLDLFGGGATRRSGRRFNLPGDFSDPAPRPTPVMLTHADADAGRLRPAPAVSAFRPSQ